MIEELPLKLATRSYHTNEGDLSVEIPQRVFNTRQSFGIHTITTFQLLINLDIWKKRKISN